MPESAKRADSTDSDLKELRDEFAYAQSEKAAIREAGAEDMRAINGDGWDPKERSAREDVGRPCIWLDELGQYVNQLINEVRQNKRSIKLAPQGRGATDKTADLRQNLIRQIEYRSNAQQAYAVMFENAAQRSYGYLRIKPEYTSHRSDDQELRIVAIPNPDMVLEDPAALRTDGGDWKFLYFGEEWTKDAFQRKWKDAQPLDFALGMAPKGTSDWIKAGRVLVAERWRIKTTPKKLLLVELPAPPAALGGPPAPIPMPVKLLEGIDTIPPGARVIRELRTVDYPTVKKQITNGIEILEEEDFPGTSIPFVACYGKVLYLEGDGLQRKVIHSLIRLARAAAMKHAYIDTCEVEVFGGVTRNAWLGYEGQFVNPYEWQKAAHEPVTYLESKLTVDGAPPGTVLPLPQRQAWDPPIQNLEMAKESARRAIQAAIGQSPLPTSAQRQNEKSGVALREIKDSGQMGSFHFVDHFDDALMRTGTILEELIPSYYDALRDVTIRDNQDQPNVVTINDPNDPESVSATDGEHDVTISVGPMQASERQAASEFADTILGSQLMQLMQPAMAAKVAALAVRLKAVGPIGDEIADMLSPKEGEGEQGATPEQVQQLQAQLQQYQQAAQQLQQQIQTEQAKQQATIEKAKIDAQVATASAQLGSQLEAEKLRVQVELQRMKDETALAIAQLQAQIKQAELQQEAEIEAAKLAQHRTHDALEAEQAERARQHQGEMASQAAANASRPTVRKTVKRDDKGQVSEIHEEHG